MKFLFSIENIRFTGRTQRLRLRGAAIGDLTGMNLRAVFETGPVAEQQ